MVLNMPYVDTSKKLSDPTKCARVWYLIEPFIDNFDLKAGGGYKKDELKKYFEKAKSFSGYRSIVGALDSYKGYHTELRKELPELKERKTIFITGISADWGTENYVGHVGHDIFSVNFRLSDEILRIANELYADGYDLEGLLIFPIAPFFFPGEIKREEAGFYLKFPFPNIFEKVNKQLPENKQVSDILLEKRIGQKIEGRKGAYDFSDILFDAKGAESALIEEDWDENFKTTFKKHIKYSTYLNSQMLAAAFDTIFDLLEIKEPPVYTKKTSYVNRILKFSKKKIKQIGGEKGPMRNTEMSILGECDPSALNVLKGYLTQALC